MASSLNQPKSESDLGTGSAFGFSWRSGKGVGPETVITQPRSNPPPGGSSEGPVINNELVPRLFPTHYETEIVSGILIGHFRIQRRIGVGGMGSVFLALDESLKREVALKILSPSLSLDHTSIQRFQNEAQAAARLDHDNIARVFYSGEEAGLHFIAYEYVPGQNLRDVIRAKGWLEPSEAVNYAIQLAAALHHSSSAGVIHRDIKPSNVLITPFGRAKLVDLGLARKTSVESSIELTVPGTTMGTFDYISPEQARDPHSVDVRSDIYSLGCTLYHMLTGEPPYPEGTVLQKLLDHQAKEPPDPSKKNRRVSPILSRVVRKMMASQPARRYATPSELLRDLLLVARDLGAGAVPIDGQVWLTATRFKPPVWQSNFGWVATTCALCLMVTVAQLYPGLLLRLMQPITGVRYSPPTVTKAGDTLGNRPNLESEKPSVDAETLTSPKLASTSGSTLAPVTSESKFFGPGKNDPSLPASPFDGDRPNAIVPIPLTTPETTPKTESRPGATITAENPTPFQIVGGGSYSTLEAACAEASDSGGIRVIELLYDGLREPERPIRLNKKKVVIRARDGFHPTIRFSDVDTSSEQPHMITVAGGSLEFFNVDLEMTVPSRIGTDRWSLFALERPEKVQLKGVTLTVNNPQYKSACFFEQRASAGQGLETIGSRLDGMPLVPPELVLTGCLVRGKADLIVMRDPVPARYELKDSAIGIDGNLLQLKLVMDSDGMERESIKLELEHLTLRSAQCLLAIEGSGGQTERLPPIIIDARNNILSCRPVRTLVSMRGLADFMDFQKSFQWRGNFNFYDNVETFLEVLSSQPNSSRKLDHNDWKNLTNEGIGSNNTVVNWRNKNVDRSYSNWTTGSFRVSSESELAVRGSDGTAGAPLDSLRPQDKN
ncbi:serine/threonine protein kinase [Schlesneria paludicola]|uniref:serine/threonine protein kinase n=1 Tax=Schlesneria paludicola TaxID=360056 RepID=UPI00029B5051|nr:serine/threonine-protein kinase [Schlesneria paludicola]